MLALIGIFWLSALITALLYFIPFKVWKDIFLLLPVIAMIAVLVGVFVLLLACKM